MKTCSLLLLICLTLFGCGGGDEPEPPAAKQTATATATAAAEGEEAVTAMFDDYREALGARDWDRACSHLAPETTEKLQQNIKQLGVTDPPSECPALMDQLYTTIDKDPAAKKTIDEITETAEVKDVKLNGEQASVTWSAKVNGQDTPVTQTARLIDGEWKLIDVN